MKAPQKLPPKDKQQKSFIQIPIISPENLSEKKKMKNDIVENQYFDLQDQNETDKPGNTSAVINSPQKESSSTLLEVPKNNLLDSTKRRASHSIKFEQPDSKQTGDGISRVCYGDVITLHMWDEKNECYDLIVLDSLQSNVYFEKEAKGRF